jgi:hypothetical protein
MVAGAEHPNPQHVGVAELAGFLAPIVAFI